MKNTISMDQVKNLLNYTIDNNLELSKKGKTPIAVSLEAGAGIGKTSIIEQVAKERGMGFTKISLHEMDEPGDIIGYPQIEYECQVMKAVKNENNEVKFVVLPNTAWMNSKQLESVDKTMKIRQTGKTRMSYAKPAWVPEYNEKGNIVILDDYIRANPQLLQSCMELILTQKYVSWSLPKGTTIFLTNNPDDGTNNVNSLDEAQRTRFLNFEVEFSVDAWAKWAEKAELDGRCINFVLSYSNELFSPDENGERVCNPRSFVMFSDMISGIKDWDNSENLNFINTIAKGCFKDEQGRFAQMFTSFIRNKMHLLIQPKRMLLGSWDTVKKTLEETLYDGGETYRPDIASLLERRFSSYVNAWLDSDEKTPIATVKDRILDFINNETISGKRLFTKDLFYHMIKTITSDHRTQTNKLLSSPEIAKMIS